MAPSLLKTIMSSRLLMWLIFLAYFGAFLAVDAVSRTLADVVLIVGFLALSFVFIKVRPRTGKWSFSTHCEECDASLQGVGGFPRATCSQCGHRQSWASAKR